MNFQQADRMLTLLESIDKRLAAIEVRLDHPPVMVNSGALEPGNAVAYKEVLPARFIRLDPYTSPPVGVRPISMPPTRVCEPLMPGAAGQMRRLGPEEG